MGVQCWCISDSSRGICSAVWVGMTSRLSQVKGSKIGCLGKRKDDFPPRPVFYFFSLLNSVCNWFLFVIFFLGFIECRDMRC